MTDAEYRALTTEREKMLERARLYRHDAVVVGQGVKRVVIHDTTKVVARAVVRNTLYVPLGAGVLIRRAWEAEANPRYERMMRNAEIAGDREALFEWESRAEQAKQNRHKRHMDWLDAPMKLVKAMALLIAGLFGLLLLLGILLAVASKDMGRILGPIGGLLDLVEWTARVLTAYGAFMLVTATALGFLYMWHLGRRRGRHPGVGRAGRRTPRLDSGRHDHPVDRRHRPP